ncbi:MAG: rhodanese-like domain-containing protein [Actinobacteria bacterium]|nr:rhodanese-like domain-containing protein [Actinomycetota bacterium]
MKEITREELKVKLDGGEGIVVVETLGPGYYEDAHLPGAINIPHTEVDELAPRLLPDKSTQVVVYCSNRACQNSPQAARRLAALGYENVYDYEEGKQDWIEAGLPTESGAAKVTG